MGGIPPLPIMPSMAGQPRPTGMLAQSGTATQSDPSAAINGFMQNYMTMKNAVKDHFKSKFMEGVSLAAQGIPVDNDKLMKYAKKGGLDFLSTEPPTPQEMQARAQQNIQTQLGAQQQVPGVQPQPDAAMQSMLMQSGQFGQAPPPRPGLLGRVGQTLFGSQPRVGGESPMGQWLTGLQQAGQESGGMAGKLGRENKFEGLLSHLKTKSLDVQGMSQEQQTMLMGMVKEAVNGGPNQGKNIENLVRMGVFKDIPLDEFTAAMRRISPELPSSTVDQNAGTAYLYAKMGGPQLKLAQMTMAKDMLPFMGNDMGKSMQYINDIFSKGGSELTPQMSPEQYKQYMEGVGTLTKAYPTAPMNLINATAHSQLLGQKATTDSLMKVISQYPREGTVDLKKHADTLGYDYATLAQKAQNEAGQLNLAVATELGKKNQTAFENWFKLASDKELDPTGDAVRAAFDGMSSAMDKDAQLKLNYRGQEIPLGVGEVQSLRNWRPSWPGGKPFLQMSEPPESILKSFLEGADSGGGKISAIKKFAADTSRMPDGREKLQALGQLMTAVQSVPKPLRGTLLQQLQLPDDMKAAARQAADELPESVQLNMGGLGKLK